MPVVFKIVDSRQSGPKVTVDASSSYFSMIFYHLNALTLSLLLWALYSISMKYVQSEVFEISTPPYSFKIIIIFITSADNLGNLTQHIDRLKIIHTKSILWDSGLGQKFHETGYLISGDILESWKKLWVTYRDIKYKIE